MEVIKGILGVETTAHVLVQSRTSGISREYSKIR